MHIGLPTDHCGQSNGSLMRALSLAETLFMRIAKRSPRRYEQPPLFPAWKSPRVEEQWNPFVGDVPAHDPPVLSRVHFDGSLGRKPSWRPDFRAKSQATGSADRQISAGHLCNRWDRERDATGQGRRD